PSAETPAPHPARSGRRPPGRPGGWAAPVRQSDVGPLSGRVSVPRGTAGVTRHEVGPRNPDTKLGCVGDGEILMGTTVDRPTDGGWPMPRALPVPLQLAISRRLRRGQGAPAIAADLGLAVRTVRKLIGRLRGAGPDAVATRYDRCGSRTPRPPAPLVQAALDL